jgi:O-antigen/teichoic acid export membrane protein
MRALRSSRFVRLSDYATTYGLLAVTKARGILVLAILGHGLGVKSIGYYTLGYTASTFASTVGSAGLGSALVLHWPDNGADERHHLVSVLYRRATLLTALSVILFVVVVYGWPSAIGAEHQQLAISALAVLALPWSWNAITENVHRAANRIKSYSAIGVAESVVEVAMLAALVLAGAPLHVVALALLVSETFLSAVARLALAQQILGTRSAAVRGDHREMVSTGASIAVSTIGAGIADRADRFVVGGVLGPQVLGVYAAAYAIASSVYSLVGPAVTVALPRLRDRWRSDRASSSVVFIERGSTLLAGVSVVGAVVVVARPLVVRIVASDADASSLRELTPVLVAAAVVYAAAQLALLPSYWDRTVWKVAWGYLGVALPGLCLSYVLSRGWGVDGAALASAVTYAALFAVAVRLESDNAVRRRMAMQFGQFALAGIMGVVVSFRSPSAVVIILLVPVGVVVLRHLFDGRGA